MTDCRLASTLTVQYSVHQVEVGRCQVHVLVVNLCLNQIFIDIRLAMMLTDHWKNVKHELSLVRAGFLDKWMLLYADLTSYRVFWEDWRGN